MTSAGMALAPSRTARRWPAILSWGAVIGQSIFTLGWMIGDAVQHGGFSPVSDDISDLGALTANHPWIILTAQGISSTMTIAFALFALSPALSRPGHRVALGALLLAGSGVALDDLSDAFFRLDCQASNAGCSTAASTASWHGQIHAIVGTITFLVMVIAPFVLARSMRRIPDWQNLAKPTVMYGVGLLILLTIYLGLTNQIGQGSAQRAISLAASAGVAALAIQVTRRNAKAKAAWAAKVAWNVRPAARRVG